MVSSLLESAPLLPSEFKTKTEPSKLGLDSVGVDLCDSTASILLLSGLDSVGVDLCDSTASILLLNIAAHEQ